MAFYALAALLTLRLAKSVYEDSSLWLRGHWAPQCPSHKTWCRGLQSALDLFCSYHRRVESWKSTFWRSLHGTRESVRRGFMFNFRLRFFWRREVWISINVYMHALTCSQLYYLPYSMVWILLNWRRIMQPHEGKRYTHYYVIWKKKTVISTF